MSAPRRKACTECRLQKVKCDVGQELTSPDPCSRCTRMRLECKIMPASTRNLRATKEEMRRQIENLEQTVRQVNPPTNDMTPLPDLIRAALPAPDTSAMPSNSATLHSSSISPSAQLSTPGVPFATPPSSIQGPQCRTLSRTLDGQSVDAKQINDCFALYWSRYHSLLPILDPTKTPDDYFALSPFLYWSIIVTGARHYEDSTILTNLSPLISRLASNSLVMRASQFQTIQALLLLCTWRLPTDSMYNDSTHVLCGSAIHLATQIGLHVAGVGQDFERIVVEKNQLYMLARAKLWVYGVTVAIRSSLAEGILPLLSVDHLDGGLTRDELLAHLPIELFFTHKVYAILFRALTAISRTDLKEKSMDSDNLRSLISIFDSQFANLTSSSPGAFETFQLNCARMHILVFHFFTDSTMPSLTGLAHLYSVSCSTIQFASSFHSTRAFADVCPAFFDRTLTLAAFSILKLYHSPLVAPHLNLEIGKEAYFESIYFSKKLSVLPNDLPTRAAGIMSQLWESKAMFRTSTGETDSLRLRLRSRLSMSVSFDMFWHWREEFGHMKDPYREEQEPVADRGWGDVASFVAWNGGVDLMDVGLQDQFGDYSFAAGMEWPLG